MPGLAALRRGLCNRRRSITRGSLHSRPRTQRQFVILMHDILHHQCGGTERDTGDDYSSPRPPFGTAVARALQSALGAFGGVTQKSMPAVRALDRLHGRWLLWRLIHAFGGKNQQEVPCYVSPRRAAKAEQVWRDCPDDPHAAQFPIYISATTSCLLAEIVRIERENSNQTDRLKANNALRVEGVRQRAHELARISGDGTREPSSPKRVAFSPPEFAALFGKSHT